MRVAILGFGLIGGSLARALRERDPNAWTVTAWSPGGTGPAAAVREGVIALAAPTPEAALDGADMVVLAAPPLACLDLLDALDPAALPRDAVVTDVASTKRAIVERARVRGLPFVGGHPMAGLESSGWDAADGALFVGRPWVICPGGPDATARVEELASATGARPIRMDPDAHDAAVAAISHLPLVVSAALVEAVATGRTPEWGDARALAAGGWASMTRLARGDVEMGAGILATNADVVAARLRGLRAVIDEWIAALDGAEPDADVLRSRLARAREALEADA